MDQTSAIRSPTAMAPAERMTCDAPMSLTQKTKENTLGSPETFQPQYPAQDVIANGIVPEDVARTSLEGCSKLSSSWLFMSTDPAELRRKSPLLFGTCILAGIYITPSLHGSETRHKLNGHVQGVVSQSQLASVVPLDTTQALLIFSMWDLRPTQDQDHSNSWLLSGIAAMRVIRTTRFETLLQTDNLMEISKCRELLRTWNLVCLCHIQFAICSDRPPVIPSEYLNECATILKFPAYNSRDELVLAEIELYRVLWELITSAKIQTDRANWSDIEKIRRKHEHICNVDSSEPLRFAYSCTYLILARRTLKYISLLQEDCQIDSQSSHLNNYRVEFIQFAVYNSHHTLSLFLSMSDLTIYVHSVYESLLCSFAMVTLAELANHIPNIFDTATLMEQVVSHIQRGGKAESVGRWSLGIVKQYITEDNDSDQTSHGASSTPDELLSPTSDILRSREDVSWNLERDFPSLQEIFFESLS